MAVKDTRLEEKEQYVVKGDILADSFRVRETGKEIGVTDAWVESMKTVVEHDTEMNEVVCGIHFYCDGDLETGADVVCGRDLIVDALANFQNPNGDPLFKVLTAAEWEQEVTKVGVVYFVVNTTTHKCDVYYYTE